jgi:hypothetical protein
VTSAGAGYTGFESRSCSFGCECYAWRLWQATVKTNGVLLIRALTREPKSARIRLCADAV